jgi:hypothetical protein
MTVLKAAVKSKTMAAEDRGDLTGLEAKQAQRLAAMQASSGITTKNGKYILRRITPVAPDLFVIAPYPVAATSAGGIALPGAGHAVSDTGIIVGVPPDQEELLGKAVKFSPMHQMPCDLTGIWRDPYGDSPLLCVRRTNIFVVIHDMPIEWVDE